MKKIYSLLMATCLVATSFLAVGCIDETEPNSVATSEQLASNATATEALLWAMPAYASTFDVMGMGSDDAYHFDYGIGSMMHIRDVMGEEYVVTAHSYDWYDYWEQDYYLGRDYISTRMVWQTYFKSILTTNQLVGAVNPETASAEQLKYLAAGKAYRASLYLDAARMYEFLPNDGTDQVNSDGKDVFGLTVPFVFDTTTEVEARNNPRATHTEAFNYIKADLEDALALILENGEVKDKQLPGLATTSGLLARAYLWHGSFLKEFGEDYDEELTANECFERAAAYAVDAQVGKVLTEAQWTDPKSGFNTINDSWLWAFTTSKENDAVQTGICNWISWVSNETIYGYASAGPIVKISPAIYDRIPTSDFRKLSWKSPSNSTLYGKLQHCLPDERFKGLPDYASLKFRPGQGEYSDYNVGSAVSVPLMRVEEMFFIEAEAEAQQGNTEKAASLLTAFMKTRDPKYSFSGGDIIDEIFFQKRVEFWGEGINYFDYKRLNKGVTRGYEGTLFGAGAQMNTTTRPAWMNFVIPIAEINNNDAIRAFNNPNPSDCYDKTDF